MSASPSSTGSTERIVVLSASEDFVDVYNQELAALACSMRVATVAEPWHSGSLVILDEAGKPIGIVPDSVQPLEMAAFARLLTKRFEQGVAQGSGRALPAAGPS
jgi:hypothetical protein